MKAILHIHHWGDELGSCFHPSCKVSSGDYSLPFPERIYWKNLEKTITGILVKWQSFFLNARKKGAVLKLEISLTQLEKNQHICTEISFSSHLMQLLAMLDIALKISCVKEYG